MKRDEHLIVNTAASSAADQYFKISTSDWLDTGYPFELASVMTYCSFCSAVGDTPVATLHDGSTFNDGERLTTTDALQIQNKYCKMKDERNGFEEGAETLTMNWSSLARGRPLYGPPL